ncbi:MAG: GxxExxY protein [Calditrichae bacterium]|nr:GxxExxY protein [Calditrichota bacterium]MCB9057497.1 GxxExxY protein [Calditrichia bacterium]
MINDDLIYKEEVFNIIGAAIDVHKHLGSGFLEAVYEEALSIESRERKIPFQTQKELAVFYKGKKLSKCYYADFVAYDKIIVELKCIPRLTSKEEAQIINYLKVTGLKLGILINFGSVNKLEWKRFIFSKD